MYTNSSRSLSSSSKPVFLRILLKIRSQNSHSSSTYPAGLVSCGVAQVQEQRCVCEKDTNAQRTALMSLSTSPNSAIVSQCALVADAFGFPRAGSRWLENTMGTGLRNINNHAS